MHNYGDDDDDHVLMRCGGGGYVTTSCIKTKAPVLVYDVISQNFIIKQNYTAMLSTNLFQSMEESGAFAESAPSPPPFAPPPVSLLISKVTGQHETDTEEESAHLKKPRKSATFMSPTSFFSST